MSLLYGTGWDLCASITDAALDGWFSVGGGGGSVVDIQTTNGRLGGPCIRVFRGNGGGNNVVAAQRAMGANITAQTFIGFAFNAPTVTSQTYLISIMDGVSNQLDLRLPADGSLTLTRNGTTLGTAPAGTVKYNSYNYYELSFVIASGTGGSVEVRRNQSTVISVSGVNTQATANASWSQVYLGAYGGLAPAQSSLVDFRYDDLYICDSNGAVNNTFLGDIGLRAALPNSVGTNSGFSRTGGSAGGNFTAVNEKPNDGDTSYVSSSTVTTTDTYLYPALTGNISSILGVLAKPVARKDDAGNRHITTRYRAPGGTEADFSATDTTLTTTYTQGLQVQELNPVTAVAWTASDLSSGEFGPKVSS